MEPLTISQKVHLKLRKELELVTNFKIYWTEPATLVLQFDVRII